MAEEKTQTGSYVDAATCAGNLQLWKGRRL